MTIRDLLQEELRKRGPTVVPEFSVSTPTGRLMPDMLLKNGVQYVGGYEINRILDYFYSALANEIQQPCKTFMQG